ncbi:MAG TPA: biotin synthase [Persephonella sp.]|uniref:Biotin synthase n=1 Tax=Persephonella marina (strain DSM 14350 / EX-H1) TaxID=123214 RepID=BIOB_PERMH|nr:MULTISPECIES: biotin synthase BioB [Persephonella]C0QR28.1 RecName: Full=Biotin synthase [Persephonella marina EX-H1]ACO03951.1 biotin synthase [Persephonella marina EX-H1]HCB68874.1 biotin synthase [Persephonella sp.]
MEDFIKGLAERVLEGEKLSKEDGLKILSIPDEYLDLLVQEASKVREAVFGDEVEFCSLINAKNGACSEDCSFCAQSSKYPTPINAYGLVPKKELVEGAQKAVSIKANRYCIVTSGKRATKEEVEQIADAVREITENLPVRVCVSIGTVDEEDLKLLKDSGVDRVNHNLETSERHFKNIVTTHSYKERLETIKTVQKVGLSTCTGGIFGIGETDEDIVDLASVYRELNVNSIPMNFLIPIPGTPLEGNKQLTPQRCLKIISLFKLFNPQAELRLCGGREINLREYHDTAMEIANCVMAGGYLTRAGRAPGKDEEMVRRLGRKLITGRDLFSKYKTAV